MNRLKLGIVLEATGLPVRRALHAASELGVRGVRVDAAGDLAPGRLTGTGRREIGNLLRAHDLELSALNCPLRSVRQFGVWPLCITGSLVRGTEL